jgi:epsilon-lactone hydrolase
MRRQLQGTATVERARSHMRALARLIPRPPRGTQRFEIDIGAMKAELVVTPQSRQDRYILYLHGGCYLLGSPNLYRDLTWRLAKLCRSRVLCIDYRLAPEHPFPAALEDAVEAYRWLLSKRSNVEKIVLVGDSAGGGLALATMLRLRDKSIELPAAAVVVSPWTDLALTGESFRQNAVIDPMVAVELAPRVVELCLAGANPRNPYVSPLYGDPAGLPPTLILVGGDDVLRDDGLRMARRMDNAGCCVAVEVWPRMWHVWPMFARVLPEGIAAIERIATFVDAKV